MKIVNHNAPLKLVTQINQPSQIEEHLRINQERYAKALSNRLQIDSDGSELIGLISNGLGGSNLTAIQCWILKKRDLVERKLDYPSNILDILSIQLRCDIYDALEDNLRA